MVAKPETVVTDVLVVGSGGAGTRAALEARLAREARFDPDFWVVEIETRDPEAFIDLATE